MRMMRRKRDGDERQTVYRDGARPSSMVVVVVVVAFRHAVGQPHAAHSS